MKISTKRLDAALASQGPLGAMFSCTNPAHPDPTTHAQSITIVVAPSKDPDFKYAVNTIPECFEISHLGTVTFTLNTGFVDDWVATNVVDVEFSLPKDSSKPKLKGPFDRYNGKPKKRGMYDDLFGKGPNVVQAAAVSQSVATGWTCPFTVKIFDKNGAFLGEVDPGIKVIDDPGSLGKKKP